LAAALLFLSVAAPAAEVVVVWAASGRPQTRGAARDRGGALLS